MIGDVIQDLEAPYRPNISSYSSASVQEAPEERSPPPHRKQQVTLPGDVGTSVPAFQTLAIFTGQDEQFAYKRALSRIFEITSTEYIKTAVFTPLRPEERVWEHDETVSLPGQAAAQPSGGATGVHELAAEPVDPPLKYARGQKVDPLAPDLDVNEMPKPRIGPTHFWGIVDTWGQKAGKWGMGVRAKEGEQKSK